MERFYNTFKSNFYNVTSFSNVEMMDELTMKYINWYNYVRPRSYNNYLTPMEARYIYVFIEQSVTKKLDQYIHYFYFLGFTFDINTTVSSVLSLSQSTPSTSLPFRYIGNLNRRPLNTLPSFCSFS